MPTNMFRFVVNPDLGKTVPADLGGLARMTGHEELANAERPLGAAIAMLEAHLRQAAPQLEGWSFFRDLMPLICVWACEQPWASQDVPLLLCGQPKSVHLTRPWLRCLMANAFLLNIRSFDAEAEMPHDHSQAQGWEGHPDTFPHHSWARVFGERIGWSCQVCVHKTLSLLAYFYYASCTPIPDNDAGVVVDRLLATSEHTSFDAWIASNAPIRSSMVRVHADSMESSPSGAFVDFANCFVGYKSIIASMTQEEILWSMVPEAQPSSLFCEAMADGEVVVIRNVNRVSAYRGYLRSCRWDGFWQAAGKAPGTLPPPAAELAPSLDILVLDAKIVDGDSQQFTPAALCRDLVKAWLGFGACCPLSTQGGGQQGAAAGALPGQHTRTISTGNWGCGAFGGNRVLKFLQQVCAIAEVNSTRPESGQLQLDFSTFGDENERSQLQLVLDALEQGQATVGQVMAMAAEYGDKRAEDQSQSSSEEEFLHWIGDKFWPDRMSAPEDQEEGKEEERGLWLSTPE